MMHALVIVLLGGLLIPVTLEAQAPVADPIRELLTEVRALRLAMERSVTVGARIQLLVARVQMQEQRIAELSRRAATHRADIAKVDTEIARTAGEAKRMEGMLERVPAEDREGFGRQIENMKAQSALPQKRRQDLLNEEALVSQQMAADQGRWSDVNNQLDELERSLALPIKQ